MMICLLISDYYIKAGHLAVGMNIGDSVTLNLTLTLTLTLCGLEGMRWNKAVHQLKARAIENGELGNLQRARLSLLFEQWPREWQQQPWCAGRLDGGPLREVGTHFVAGIMEIFGYDAVVRVQARIEYPDGPGGSLSESSVQGVIELKNGLAVCAQISLCDHCDLYAE